METKKHSSQDLNQRYALHLAVGLITSFSLVIVAFEWQTPLKSHFIDIGQLEKQALDPDYELLPPVLVAQPPPPKPVLKTTAAVTPTIQKQQIREILNLTEVDSQAMTPLTLDLVPEPVEVAVYADRSAEPAEGWKKLQDFLKGNLRYPRRAKQIAVEGKVYVSFVISKTGKITDVTVVKGLGFGCDQEAVRVVSMMPDWIPASRNGLPVAVKMLLPIQFKLQ